MTRVLRCTVEYDGTAFAGFQRQPQRATVQGALETAIAAVAGAAVTVVGAGRTDAGVHAIGQVIHFDCDSALPIATMQRALNARLPASVRVRQLEEAPSGFHARFDAQSREYRYVVENAAVASPLWRARACFVPHALDLAAMAAAADLLLGRHDFSRFGSPMEHAVREEESGNVRTMRGNTWRTLLVARCWRRQRFVLFCFVADAFLRHMVRMLVGTLLRIGRGALRAEAIPALLEGERSFHAGPAAPAHGLYLTRVQYALPRSS